MGFHPINLILRFLLEIIALVSFGMWGYQQSNGWTKILWAILMPVLFAILWATFAVPNDPSRSGAAPIVVSGWVRLILEFAFFAAATWCLRDIAHTKASLIFGGIVLVHYLISYDRIAWLMEH